jgi:hypothetical protein
MRHIGVALPKTNFVGCFLADDQTTRTQTYPLTKTGINRFLAQLEPEDEVAVEVTANIYYFYDQVKPHVSRVVLVDTYRFAVIARSKKNGIALARAAFASRLSRARLARRDDLAPADALIMQAALRQIE